MFLDDCGGFPRSLLVGAVVHQDIRAGLGKPDRHCLAKPFACSRHQCLLSHQHPMYRGRRHFVRRCVFVFWAHWSSFGLPTTYRGECRSLHSARQRRLGAPFKPGFGLSGHRTRCASFVIRSQAEGSAVLFPHPRPLLEVFFQTERKRSGPAVSLGTVPGFNRSSAIWSPSVQRLGCPFALRLALELLKVRR